MRLVAYLRVSTDDKGQNPERQRDVISSWAERQGHEIIAWWTDEGVSGGLPPFQRQGFLSAVESAKSLKADGIAAEAIDRLTRGGVMDLAQTQTRLSLEDGLQVYFADLPQMDGIAQELVHAVLACVAKMFRERLREQIKTGLARAKKNGFPNGRPGRKPKPPLSELEVEACLRLMDQGKGGRTLAKEISQARGAFEVADIKLRRTKSVTETWIRDQLVGLCKENARVALRVERRWPGLLQPKQDESGQGASL